MGSVNITKMLKKIFGPRGEMEAKRKKLIVRL